MLLPDPPKFSVHGNTVILASVSTNFPLSAMRMLLQWIGTPGTRLPSSLSKERNPAERWATDTTISSQDKDQLYEV